MDSNAVPDKIRSLEHDIEHILSNRQTGNEEEDSSLMQLEKSLSLLFFEKFRESSNIEDVRRATRAGI